MGVISAGMGGSSWSIRVVRAVISTDSFWRSQNKCRGAGRFSSGIRIPLFRIVFQDGGWLLVTSRHLTFPLPDDAERLPCGCVAATIGDRFVYQPCSLNCHWYKYVMDQAAEMSIPAVIREGEFS